MGSSILVGAPGQPTQGPDKTYTSPSIPNLVSFGFKEVTPPTGYYVQRDDVLNVQAVSYAAGEQLFVAVRLLLPFAVVPGQPDAPNPDVPQGVPIVGPGQIQTSLYPIQLPLALTSAQLIVPLSEGYLLSVSLIAASAIARGSVFAQAVLQRGVLGVLSGGVNTLLARGYVTNQMPITWPYSVPEVLAQDRGAIRIYAGTNPGAGADFTVSTTAHGRVRFAALRAQFVASAAVANRFVGFTLSWTTGPTAVYSVQDSVATTAGQTVIVSLGPSVSAIHGGGTAPFISLPTPDDLYTQQNLTISSVTNGIQGADQWSSITLTTEEWFELF